MKCINYSPLLLMAGLALLNYGVLGIRPARSATLVYDFTVDITQGILVGESFSGWFSFDETRFTGMGTEVFNVSNDNLKIEFSFLGKFFTEADESFELFGRTLPVPNVTFQDGILQGLSYRVDENRGNNQVPIPDPVIDFTFSGFGFGYRDLNDDIFENNPIAYQFRERIAMNSIPEPNMILGLLAVGAASFLASRSRSRNEDGNPNSIVGY